ncbi:hypothetical protein LJC26_03345 [Desulfovibrio sp. OttesenSCG-928-O18]|nr:hypothetical protein [Desulfovibrio sp. OttesenSCG-928-O18]
MVKIRPFRLLAALPLLLLFVAGTAGAATTRAALSGTWGIDVDRTLPVNEMWKRAHDGLGPEDRATLRRKWETKELVVDFTAYTLEERVEGEQTQRCRVAEVHQRGEGLRVTVFPPEAPSYLVDMTLQEPDFMLFVIEEKTHIVLKRKKKPEW